MSRVFSYKLSRDFGFAPNPFHGICTLATCKPQIRNAAQVGDLIVGCGSKALKLEEKIIFVMRVTEKLTFQKYWEDPRFFIKRANLKSSKAAAYGDNIYHYENGEWIQEDSHHSFEGGVKNQDNFDRDLGSENVLISDDFVYWGSSAPCIPDNLRDLDGEDLYPDGRFYRAKFPDNFKSAVYNWFESLPMRGNQGRPTCW